MADEWHHTDADNPGLLRRAKAMRAYTQRLRPRRRGPDLSATQLFESIRTVRDEIRRDEGGGGMCHLVTEWLTAQHGFDRIGVSYLAPNGDVITAGHYVSITRGGSLLDPTSDQFGEGRGITLLRLGDPDFGRYRPEFDEDFNPAIYPDDVGAWNAHWRGRSDFDEQDRLETERGTGWWLSDRSLYRSYLCTQRAFAEAKPCESIDYAAWCQRRIDAIDQQEVDASANVAVGDLSGHPGLRL